MQGPEQYPPFLAVLAYRNPSLQQRSTDAWRNITEDLNLPIYYCLTCTRNLASHSQRRIYE